MIKRQWLGEIVLGTSVPNLLEGINELWENLQNEMNPNSIEVHQVITDGPGRYVVIFNYYV